MTLLIVSARRSPGTELLRGIDLIVAAMVGTRSDFAHTLPLSTRGAINADSLDQILTLRQPSKKSEGVDTRTGRLPRV